MGEDLTLSVCQVDRQLCVRAVSENQFDKLPPPGKAPTHPPLLWPLLIALSWSLHSLPLSLLVLFVWHLSHTSPSSGMIDPAAPFPDTHIHKRHALAQHLGPPFLFAWQKRQITVIDFHVAGTPGKLFEGLYCDEYQIWDQRRRGKIGWERDGEKKKKSRREIADLVLQLCALTSFCHSTPFFLSLFPHPWLAAWLLCLICVSFFIHIHLSLLPWHTPTPHTHTPYPSLFLSCFLSFWLVRMCCADPS